MNGADLLCDTLLANGIDVCFANPGTSEMHFVAALDNKPQMRCVLGLSEGVVTGAADGYARMADKPAATLLHCGPGLANGIANLHNAKRANTPLLNVVGDHATYHLALDAPLTSDIDSLARPVSGWVGRADKAAEIGLRTREAILNTRQGARGQVSTLILPADTAWTQIPETEARAVTFAPAPLPDEAAIRAAAIALRKPGAMLLIGSDALRERGLVLASRISQATGALLRTEVSNRRTARGAGRVAILRIPYAIDLALEDLAGVQQAVLVAAKVPVGFFAYPGKPGYLLPEGCTITHAASVEEDAVAALEMLAEALGIGAGVKADQATREIPDCPSGALTAPVIGAIVARNMPENAIFVDEGVTSGAPVFAATFTAAPHDHIQLTGGAIGDGIPMAVGAAIACPDRKVISMQADGSGAYTLQGLWTQAREQLDIVTVIYANRRYAILRGELTRVGANAPGVNAARMLDLDDPALDWVQIAQGFGLPAVRVETAEDLDAALARAVKTKGPMLIEAVMP